MSKKTRLYGRKTTYKNIINKRDMGLNNEVCKHKVAYCTLKKVFLNEEQVCKKFCRCKKVDEITGETKPCNHLVLKNEKPEKFTQCEKKSIELHAKKKKVDKNHMLTLKQQEKGGKYVEVKVPLCFSKTLSNEKTNPNKFYVCTYGDVKKGMSERLCKERRCQCGKFGKISGEPCPYLLDKSPKVKKKKSPQNNQKQYNQNINHHDFFKDDSIDNIELKEDEIMILGKIVKKSDIGL